MEITDRSKQTHRATGGTGGDFFICFTSRRRPTRLRTSGSVRGAQSPAMFTTSVAEPSSPKVTCIGQVRVKTSLRRRKKKEAATVAAMRSRSTRETSFRRTEHREPHQSWVHLPLGLVCDALRSFGSEINCCFKLKFKSCCLGSNPCHECCSCPCSGSFCGRCTGGCGGGCTGGCGGGCTGGCGGGGCTGGCGGGCCGGCTGGCGCGECSGGCGDGCDGGCGDGCCGGCGGGCGDGCHGGCGGGCGDGCHGGCSGECGTGCCGGKRKRRKEVMVVVEEMEVSGGGRRRELDFIADELEAKSGRRFFYNKEEEEGEEIPACVPPKNALLLMRCRSDPARVSALQNRFKVDDVEDPEPEVEEEEENAAVDDYKREDEKEERISGVEREEERTRKMEREIEEKVRIWQQGDVKGLVLGNGSSSDFKSKEKNIKQSPPLLPPPNAVFTDRKNQKGSEVVVLEEEQEVTEVKTEEMKKHRRKAPLPIKGPMDERRKSTSKDENKDRVRRSFSSEKELVRRSTSYREGGRRSSFSSEGEARRSSFSVEKETKRRWSFSSEKESKATAPGMVPAVSVVTGGGGKNKEKNELPDCLLLMMYEPKLSMEVSKETWVCSADFHRWQPHRRRQQQQVTSGVGGENEKPKVAEESEDGEYQGENTDPITASAKPLIETITAAIPSPLSHKAEPAANKSGKTEASGEAAAVAAVTVPFVLTRCKSEPTRMNTSPGKLSSPEGYFWKSMPRLIGVAGIGF